MTTKIFNITNQIVVREIEDVLDTYPHHPYQKAFAIPNLRQKLIAYILSQVRNIYIAIEEGEELRIGPNFLSRSLEQRPHIESVIRQGIVHILQEDAEWVSRHIPERVEPGTAPSYWFG